MKIFIFSDLHGKIDNVIEIIKSGEFDEYIFAGDIFGYFICENEVFDLLNQFNIKIILGNHDLYFLKEANPDLFNKNFYRINKLMISNTNYNNKYGCLYENIKNINIKKLEYLYTKSLSSNFIIDNLNFFVSHGSPYNHFDHYVYPDYENFDNLFLDFDFDVLIMGHTHKAFYKYNNTGNKVIINPGSCTLPRNEIKPSYVIFDTKNLNVNIKYIDQQIKFLRETKNKLIEIKL